MRYFLAKTLSPCDCLVVGIFKNQEVSELTLLNEAQHKSIQNILQIGDFSAKLAQVTTQYFLTGFETKRVILVGLGEKERYSLAIMRKAMAAVGKALIECQTQTLQIILPGLKAEPSILFLRQAIISLEDAHVRRDQLKTQPAPVFWPERISFVGDYSNAEEGLSQGELIARAIKLAKNLGNAPANYCTPSMLADRAVEVAKKSKIAIDVYDENAIKEFKMGAFLAVAQGSIQLPRLIVLRYEGTSSGDAPIVLVGKGVTFDSGGISLKAGIQMDEMKYDMCGAATVIATMQAAAQLALPLNLVGIIVSTENLPSGAAVKPGDVITTMSGKTVEILNTDAEGRLILSDALTFAERFHPKEVIDVATLTGAVMMTFGSVVSGLMGNDQNLVQALLKAGEQSGDRAWQLPINEEYQELNNTPFADVANITYEAKGITAGCFLARFTEKYRWAHLDIAGTAWVGGSHMVRAASGRPVSLLMHYLLAKSAGEE